MPLDEPARRTRPRRMRFQHRSRAFRCIRPRYGGSYPPRCHGWHRQMRPTPRTNPDTAPYFRTASIMYRLHEGSNRHWPPSSGLRKTWYSRTRPISSCDGR